MIERRNTESQTIAYQVGVIGYGYWGSTLFATSWKRRARRVSVCDLRSERLARCGPLSDYQYGKHCAELLRISDRPIVMHTCASHFDLEWRRSSRQARADRETLAQLRQVVRLIEEAERRKVSEVYHTFFTERGTKIRELSTRTP